MSVQESIVAAPVSSSPIVIEESVNQTKEPVVAESAVTETPVIETPKEPEPDLSAGFAALARKEKKLFEAAKQAKEDREYRLHHEKRKLEAKTNPNIALEDYGLTINDYVNHSVGESDKHTPEAKVKSLEERIAKFEKDKLEHETNTAKKAEEARVAGLVEQYKEKLFTEIKATPEKYPLIVKGNRFEDVLELADKYAAQYGKLIPNEKAAELIEAELVKEKEAAIIAARELLKEFAPSDAPKATPKEESKIGNSNQTLTERIKQTPSANSSTRSMSREDSLKEAAKLLAWK